MSTTQVIRSIRAAFTEAVPGATVYLQLAPKEAQAPFAVMQFASIEPGDGDLNEKDYASGVAFALVTTSDTACLEALDSILSRFDRGMVDGTYSTLLSSASFDIQYTEQAALWVAEASFSVRWTVRV